MAFRNQDLSVIAYANGFTMWHYASTDSLETITSDNYFEPVKTLANTGDIVIINAPDGTAMRVMELSSDYVKLTTLK